MWEKLIKFLKYNYKWLICFGCLIIFLLIAEDVFTKEIMRCDTLGYQIISKYLIYDAITPIAKVITWFGSAWCLIGVVLGLLILIKNMRMKVFIGLNLVLITFLNQTLKFIVERPRPDGFRLIDESGYSFPSGHSMISMAFYGFLIYLVYNNVQNRYVKISLIVLLSLLILLIGVSRIYLGVHYTSDVLAGFLISLSYLVLYTSFYKKDVN